jgi:ABC-type sugar transport system permease subunit
MKKSKKLNISPYLYVLPAAIIVVFVYFYPIVVTIRNSFFRITYGREMFIGLDNYAFLFIKDTIFKIALLNNFRLLLGIPILTIFALIVASLLYQQIIGWKLFRIVKLIPYILSITVIGMIFDYILRINGLFNSVLKALHLEVLALDWLGSQELAIYSILSVVIWKELGFGVILFLARMLSVDPSLFDAAKVDGASWLRILFSVTIPELGSVIAFYVIINVINMLSWMFNYIFVMTRGGPIHSTYVLEFYIYRMGIRFRQMGVASTAAVILLLISIMFVVLQYFFRKNILHTEEL